jgi:hypothetical protein
MNNYNDTTILGKSQEEVELIMKKGAYRDKLMTEGKFDEWYALVKQPDPRIEIGKQIAEELSRTEWFMSFACGKAWSFAHFDMEKGVIDDEADLARLEAAKALLGVGFSFELPDKTACRILDEFTLAKIARILFGYWYGLPEEVIAIYAKPLWTEEQMDTILEYVIERKVQTFELYRYFDFEEGSPYFESCDDIFRTILYNSYFRIFEDEELDPSPPGAI